MEPVFGILVVLAAVVTWSVASVFMRQLTAKYPPILVTAYGMVISLIFHIPTGVAASWVRFRAMPTLP